MDNKGQDHGRIIWYTRRDRAADDTTPSVQSPEDGPLSKYYRGTVLVFLFHATSGIQNQRLDAADIPLESV